LDSGGPRLVLLLVQVPPPVKPPLGCVQAAVAAAVSSGAAGLEAAVLVGGSAEDPGVGAVTELSPTATVIVTDRAGTPLVSP